MKKTYKILVFVTVVLGLLIYSDTTYACMLASGCEGSNFSLYSYLNKEEATEDAEIPPEAVIKVRNDTGNIDQYSGTTNTTFTFDGNGSHDQETSSFNLEVRFDFENDGKPDTYYSRTKSASYKYTTPGVKTVKMQVLDRQGNVSVAYTNVLVVENTPPQAYFTVNPLTGTPATIFKFDTKASTDSQYSKNLLEYRFDFNGDGKYDTKFQKKNLWQHQFNSSGEKMVILQVKDPEGAVSTYAQKITINPNTPPIASFTYKGQFTNKNYTMYKLDASQSYDKDGGNLKYKWDFNYTGDNDIIWNTPWNSSPLGFANFYKTGEYFVKLLVKDEDGATNSTIVKIAVDLISTLPKKAI